MLQAGRAGVSGCLVPSYSPNEWDRQTLLRADPRIRNALGIHPWALSALEPDTVLETLDEAFRRLPPKWGESLVAVGECGLDRAKADIKKLFQLQLQLFDRHLYWAVELELPVIVHSVRAAQATLEALRTRPCRRGGVLHSFGGPAEMIPDFMELGMRFSYSERTLHSARGQESLKATPPERLLWETDGPGSEALGPQNLPEVVEFASQILGKSIEWCWSVHNENMSDLFDIQETT